ncbi:hypothetical protein [Hydrogenophaga sp.]|uniref:hypothetical protein n=1 Tax=Hydrogenophaga sp. TaxID=1904254 RepID=UPI0025BAC766|nr:hypothetical protein [Hydrogenophaga sp.]
MKTLSLKAHWARTSALARGLTLAALAASAWAMSTVATPAQARDNISWSIGVHSPGVAVGVSNYPPVYGSRYPVYEERYPVYEERRPIYHRPIAVYPHPVMVYPQPIYVQPRPYYRSNWGHSPRWDDRRHGHGHRGHGHRGHDRRGDRDHR